MQNHAKTCKRKANAASPGSPPAESPASALRQLFEKKD